MPHRIFIDRPLAADLTLALPSGATRHTQVLRMQPGDAIEVFNGQGGEWYAEIVQMSRKETTVRVLRHESCDRELSCPVALAVGIPANERMDWLVEKATELGAASIQPLTCLRSVLRLDGARAEKRVAHWQAIAIAACEQSGRTIVPTIHPIQTATSWLAAQVQDSAAHQARYTLSLRDSRSFMSALNSSDQPKSVCLFSGPEGGLTEDEENAALAAGHIAVSLGPRTLRADTAPLAALAIIGSR